MSQSNNNHPYPYNKGELADIMFNAILNNESESIYFKDLDSKFIVLSKHLAQYFGLDDPIEAIGKSDFDFFSNLHARQAFNDEQNVIRTKKALLNVIETETWASGKRSYVISSKYPLFNNENELIGTWGHSITMDNLQHSAESGIVNDRMSNTLEDYKSLTKIDHLTKLKNVKAFYDDMNLTYQMAMNQLAMPEKDQALIMIDINGFTSLNDEFGHHGGDSALLFLAEILEDVTKNKEDIFIYGTDQFAILTPVHNIIDAKTMAERVINNVESDTFSHDGVDLQLHLNIGICTFKEILPIGSIYDLINLADSRLNEAKKIGPNSIVYERL